MKPLEADEIREWGSGGAAILGWSILRRSSLQRPASPSRGAYLDWGSWLDPRRRQGVKKSSKNFDGQIAQGRVENGIPTLLGDAGRGRNRPVDPFLRNFKKLFSP